MKTRFVTHVPAEETSKTGITFTATLIERIILLRAHSKSHGYPLGLVEAKKLVEINNHAIVTVHQFTEFLDEVVNARKEEDKDKI